MSNNRHKQVACSVCTKMMRDDNVKRHMKLHADLDEMGETEKRAELERRKEAYEHREKQREETRSIAQEIGAPPPCYEQSTSVAVHGDDLRSQLQNDKRKHAEKVEYGREIEAIINDGDASEESLTKENKNDRGHLTRSNVAPTNF